MNKKIIRILRKHTYARKVVYHIRKTCSKTWGGGDEALIDPFDAWAFYNSYKIISNPYKKALTELTEDQKNEIMLKKLDKNVDSINTLVKMYSKSVPIFKAVEIETINRCNGTCDFCPVNKKMDQRQKSIMPRELFDDIIKQLKDIKYDGRLGLYSNNEPLLDERIVELCKHAKESLPEAWVYLYTNGTLFTIDKFKNIIPYLDELVIDNYTQNLKLIKPCKEIVKYIRWNIRLRKKVTIVLRKPDEILSSRGGDAPNRKNIITSGGVSCLRPFNQFVIRPDGRVSLCCHDPLGRDTLGDLTKETILGVWYGSEYGKVREAISKGRDQWDHCKHCDAYLI